MIDWKKDLEILMPKLTEGKLSKDEEKQLEKILGSNPEARNYYLSYIDVDTALEEQIGIPNFDIMNLSIQEASVSIAENKSNSAFLGYWKLGISVAAAIALLLYLFNGNPNSATATTIKSLLGSVKIIQQNGNELMNPKVGTSISIGSTIETVSMGSFVELEFPDQSIFTLSDLSQCVILRYDSNYRELRLLKGKFTSDIKTKTNKTPLKVYTPSFSLNVLEAKFDIDTMEEFSYFRAGKGKVQLTRLSDSQSKEVSENQEIFFSDGQVSSPLNLRTTEKWEVKTSSGKIPLGWVPFSYDSNDKSDPFLLRRRNSGNWDSNQRWEVKTSSGTIPEGWEPFGYDSNDKSDPFLMRRRTSGNWDDKQKWEIKTSSRKIPESWEPFGYDSNDKSDPFLMRRRTSGNWDDKQKWEIKTSSGRGITAGWEPFAYDSNDEQDPFLLRRRTAGNWDNKQKWQIKTSPGKIPLGWEPFGYDSNDKFDPYLLRRRIK